MTDRYATFAHSVPGKLMVRRLGLPDPPRLRRHHPGDPLVPGPVLLGAAPGSRLADTVARLLSAAGVQISTADAAVDTDATQEATAQEATRAEGGTHTDEAVTGAHVPAGEDALAGGDVSHGGRGPEAAVAGPNHGQAAGPGSAPRYSALVYDATGILTSEDLRDLYCFFHPRARALHSGGRVIVLGSTPELCHDTRAATAQQALEGFVRSVGKEFGRGSTAQLVYVAPGEAAHGIESTLRFLLSGRSAYVSGQVIRISAADGATAIDWEHPLSHKIALVTGAAQGIGAAIARVLARDGAHVVALDLPAAGDALAKVANDIGGTSIQLDLASAEAPGRLVEYLSERHDRVDIVVHNAGITRDKTLARMRPEQWDSVIDVNLSSQERVNEALLRADLIPTGGRLIGVSSIAGIAGNRGQTNYATSKAGVIGLVRANAVALGPRGITANAVAPGFIETRMTARMPLMPREAGRRMNSMAQGGLPVDVAETIAWLASPGSSGVTGNVVRVCGQSLLGA